MTVGTMEKPLKLFGLFTLLGATTFVMWQIFGILREEIESEV